MGDAEIISLNGSNACKPDYSFDDSNDGFNVGTYMKTLLG